MRKFLFLLVGIIFMSSCRKTGQPDVVLPGPDPIPTWKLYTTLNSPLIDNQINAIAIDSNDTKWIGTSKGLLSHHGSDWTAFKLAKLPDPYVTSITIGKNRGVWVGTTTGLALFKDSGWTVFTKENSVLPDNEIVCMTYEAKDETLWVATSTSFVKIQNNIWTVIDDVDHELILSMTTDSQGALWLGTFNHIAFRGNIRKYHNGKWTGTPLPTLGYYSAFPYAIATDKNNSIIATLTGTSVRAIIKNTNGNWDEIQFPEAARGFKALLVEGEKIWVAGKNLALLGNKSFSTIAIPGTDSPIQCIAIDSKGSKWLGTIYGGLAVYSDK